MRSSERWFADLDADSAVLDLGCGGGAWTALFAQRYRRVVGIEQSANMVADARERLRGMANVELIEGDCLQVEIERRFDGAFFGGMLMYLNRDDAVRLLARVGELVPDGPIILRESGRERVSRCGPAATTSPIARPQSTRRSLPRRACAYGRSSATAVTRGLRSRSRS